MIMKDCVHWNPFIIEKTPSQDGLKPKTTRLVSQHLTLLHSELF